MTAPRVSKALFTGLATIAVAGLLAIAVSLGGTANAAKTAAPADRAVIVLSASWCGTCREITPLVQRIVTPDMNLKVIVLDVDSTTAPAQAAPYGVTIGGSNVPEVYLYNAGKTDLIFNGQGYKFGQSKIAESQIRQRLQVQH